MSVLSPTVTVFFGTGVNPSAFTLNHATKGLLDDATYTLGGDVGTDISGDVVSIDIRRGRNRELDSFDAGTCTVSLVNQSGDYSTRNDAGPYFGNLVPGRRVRVEKYNQTIFEGIVARWTSRDEADGTAIAVLEAEDALAQLGRIEFDEWTATGSQTAGDRLNDALNRPEVNFGSNRDFSTGVSVLQADVVAQGTNVQAYCQLVAQSDLGVFFATRNNQLRFKDRHDVPDNVSGSEHVVEFSDRPPWFDHVDRPQVPFLSYGTGSGSDFLVTRVVVERQGGSAQSAEDADAIDDFGVRTLSQSGLLQDSDDQCLSMAEFLLGAYLDPAERVNEVVVNLTAYEGQGLPAAKVAQLDLSEFCLILFNGGADGLLRIEGIEHDITVGGSHIMTFRLSNALQTGSFLLDDSIYGLLDSNPLGF